MLWYFYIAEKFVNTSKVNLSKDKFELSLSSMNVKKEDRQQMADMFFQHHIIYNLKTNSCLVLTSLYLHSFILLYTINVKIKYMIN